MTIKRVYPNHIPIRARGDISISHLAQFVNNEWQIKTDGPIDADSLNGSYVVLCADGSVIRRTLDSEGFIIHEMLIKKGRA